MAGGNDMKRTRGQRNNTKFNLAIWGRDFLHFGPNVESASHHFPRGKVSRFPDACDRLILFNFIVEVNSDVIFSVKFGFSVESDAES